MTVVTFTSGSGTWTVPAGVTSFDVVVVSGGAGWGGAGGESSLKTSDNSTTIARATGGAVHSGNTGGAGGAGTHGDTLFNGGAGGTGAASGSDAGGGGGGGAGSNANGGAGGNRPGGDGYGGDGGAGGAAGAYGVSGGPGGKGYQIDKNSFGSAPGSNYGGAAGGSTGGGGGGGGAARKLAQTTTPGTVYNYVVGAAGSAGGGSAGAGGIVRIEYADSAPSASGAAALTGGGLLASTGRKGGLQRVLSPPWDDAFIGDSLGSAWTVVGGTAVVGGDEVRVRGTGITRALALRNPRGVDVFVQVTGFEDLTGSDSALIEVKAAGLSQKFGIRAAADGHVYAEAYNAAGTHVVNAVDLGWMAIGWYRLRISRDGKKFEVAHAPSTAPRVFARHLRLEMYDGTHAGGLNLLRFAELEIASGWARADVTPAGAVCTSGTNFGAGWTPNQLINNNLGDEWAATSGTTVDWVNVAFGALTEVAAIRLYQLQTAAGDFPHSCAVFASGIVSPGTKTLNVDHADWRRVGTPVFAAPGNTSWTPWAELA